MPAVPTVTYVRFTGIYNMIEIKPYGLDNQYWIVSMLHYVHTNTSSRIYLFLETPANFKYNLCMNA